MFLVLKPNVSYGIFGASNSASGASNSASGASNSASGASTVPVVPDSTVPVLPVSAKLLNSNLKQNSKKYRQHL